MSEALLELIAEALPLLEALAASLSRARSEERHEQAIAELSEGFQNAAETGDTSLLERAIRAHLGSDGVRDNVP